MVRVLTSGSLLAAFAVMLSACAGHTERLARDPNVCRALVAWVDATVTDDLVEGNGLRLYVGPRPGSFWVDRPFDSVAAGLGEGQWFVTLICRRTGDQKGERIAVYFCDGGREGIVVRLKDEWGVEASDLSKVAPTNDRVAFHSTTD